MEETISDNGYSNMQKMLEDCLYKLQENAAMDSVAGISSGFRPLDDLVGGFQNGKVYIIGGRPCMGKEEFMLSMIRSIAVENKLPVMLFSTRHMKSDYVYIILSIHCDISTLNLQNGLVELDEWVKIDKSIKSLADAPLFIHDSLDLSLDDLMETAKNCIGETGIKIIFIDCLQMIDFAHKEETASESMTKVMCSLKQLAQKENLPIVVGSMLSRDRSYWDDDYVGRLPDLTNLPGNASVEELADVVMLVHRPEYYHVYEDEHGNDLHGQIQILVKKNGLKPVGEIILSYHQKTGAVKEMRYLGSYEDF